MRDGIHRELVLPKVPFKTDNSAATVFWALTNASLGVYIAFTLLSQSKERDEPLKRRSVWIVLAAFALTFGCCACQLSTARIHLAGDSKTFISFNIGIIVLSVVVATISIVSAFLLFQLRLDRGEGLRRSIAFRSCACSLLVGLSVGFMHYLPFLSLPSYKATLIPTQICLVLLLVISGSLFSLLILTFLINKYIVSRKFPAYMLLHALVSLVFGSCILGAGMLSLSGIRFEPKGGSIVPEEPSEGARKQRDVLTRAIPAIITVILACSAVYITFSTAHGEPRYRYRRRLYAHTSPTLYSIRPAPLPRLTLASIAFGADGRILLNQKGMLPVQSVSLVGLPEDILDELDSSRSCSSTFQWLLAISSDWTVVSPFLRRIAFPRVRIHAHNSSCSPCANSDDNPRSFWYSIFPNAFHLTQSQSLFFRFPQNGKTQSSPSGSSGAVPATASTTEAEGRRTGEDTEEDEEELIRAQARGKLRLRLLEASTQLAAQLGVPLEKLGTLHDQALETGTRIGTAEFLSLSDRMASFVRDANLDAEEGPGFKASAGGRGLMLFFVRFLPQHHQQEQQRHQSAGQSLSVVASCSDSQRRESFIKGMLQGKGGGKHLGPTARRSSHRQDQGQSERRLPPLVTHPKGFKMRFMGRFRDVLAETTGAKPEDVDKVLNGCKNTATRKSTSVLEAGCTYVSLFVERVSCDGSSEVLVYDFARHQLPSYRLDLPTLTKDMRDWLHKMSGFAASDIIDICKDEAEQGRVSACFAQDHTFACDLGDPHHELLAQQVRREREVEATLVDFKEALEKALAQLMSDMCFVGESLDTWAYLTSHILDVPSVAPDSDSRASGSSSEGPERLAPAHMIIFHAEIPDPLDAELLEGESDFTHLSASSASASTNRDAQTPQMPSVFEYIPRTLFDVVHALAVLQPAREAFRVEATKELEWLTSAEYARAETMSARNRRLPSDAVSRDGHRVGGHAPARGRLSRALVSSFSVDSLSDEEGVSHRGAGVEAIKARAKKSWAAVKTRARALSFSRRRNARHEGHTRTIRTDHIPLSSSGSFAQSASRTHLLLSRSRSHTASSSTTATTMTTTTTNTSIKASPVPSGTSRFSILGADPISKPQPIVFSQSRADLNSNPYPHSHSHSQRHSCLRSGSAVELASVARASSARVTSIRHTDGSATRTGNAIILNADASVPLPESRSASTSNNTNRTQGRRQGQGQGRSQSRGRGQSQSRSHKSRWLEVPAESVPIPIPDPLPVSDTTPGISVLPRLDRHEFPEDGPRRSVIYRPNSGTVVGYGDRRSVATRMTASRSTPDVARTGTGSFF